MKDDHIATILADNLEAIEQGEMSLAECLARYPERREEMVELLGLALAIRDLPPITPRPGFRYTARSRLLRSVAARQQVKQRGRRERVFRFSFPNLLLRPALSLAILIVLLVVTLSAGTAYAAGSALPGDSLYSVKIAVEDARLMLSSEEGDASLYLQFADERLQEIDSLAAKGRYEDISTATQRFEEQLQAASETMNTLPSNSTAQLENQAVHLNENLAYTKAFLETLQATQLLPDAAKFGIGQAIQASAKGQSKLHAMFPDKVPGPPESVSPGPPEEVSPSVDKPQGAQGVGPQKSPGPPEDKGQGQGQDKDKGKPDKSKEPSQNNSQGPPPDVTQGPPGDKDKSKDSPNNPLNNKPANGKP
jgi:hypothetical protein